jgi:hypothetical protein
LAKAALAALHLSCGWFGRDTFYAASLSPYE